MELKGILQRLVTDVGTELEKTIGCLLPSECTLERSDLGNLLVKLPGNQDETLLLDAHMDTIGFVVTHITSEGYLKVASRGGVDCRVLSGSEVIVFGSKRLYGVFTIMPPHLKRTSGADAVSVEEQAIDIGCSFEQAKELVKPGDFVVLKSDVLSLENNMLVSRGLDNLAGVAALILLAHKLCKSPNRQSIVIQFSNFEETGHRFAGGTTGAFSVLPDEAIVVDASFGKVPGLNYATPGELGNGAMIGFSPMLSSKISCTLRHIAQNKKIIYTEEILGGASGTNADGIVCVGNGIPTGLLSYPLLNMHTGVEMICEQDINALVDLLEAYCLKGVDESDE